MNKISGISEYNIEIKTVWASGNVTRHMHFTKKTKYRKMLCAEIAQAINFRCPPSPFELAHIQMTRFSCSLLDDDNLFGGIKPLLDCLVPVSTRHPSGLGFIKDDNPASLILCVGQKHVETKGEEKSQIKITRLSDDDEIMKEKLKQMNLTLEKAQKLRKIRMAP